VVYRIAADGVVVVHVAFIVFVAVGGVVAWRWPRLLWLHVCAVAWGVAIIAVGFSCPLTPLERYLRRRGDEQGYEGGFVDRYIEDVIYPGGYTWLVRTLIAAAVIVGWTGVTVRWARRCGLALSARVPHAASNRAGRMRAT
jgi:Protein of Unknown function (DUF2784)